MHTCSPEEEGDHSLRVSFSVASAQLFWRFFVSLGLFFCFVCLRLSCLRLRGNVVLLTWQRFPVVEPGGYTDSLAAKLLTAQTGLHSVAVG